MAGKPKPMSQVKQILRLYHQGKGIKTIARSLSVSKNTVKDYIQKSKASNLLLEVLLALEDPVLEGKLNPGNPAYKDERYDRLKPQLDYFSKELKKTGVNRQVLWDEYKAGNPDPYSYAQFCWILRTKLRQAFRFHCASDFGSNCATSLRDFGSFCATLKDRAITLSPKNRRYGKYT